MWNLDFHFFPVEEYRFISLEKNARGWEEGRNKMRL
jgi:hypothetical protein